MTTSVDPALSQQQSCVLWFTGLSGAGKSTLAAMVAKQLREQGHHCELLDGDVVRRTTSNDLGFSEADRRENMRRLGELALATVHTGGFALVAAISPFKSARDDIRQLFAAGQFVEVFVDAPLQVCEARDPKGLYRKARQGEIRQFTGIDSVYEQPERPDIHLRTDELDPGQCVQKVLRFLETRKADR